MESYTQSRFHAHQKILIIFVFLTTADNSEKWDNYLKVGNMEALLAITLR